MAKVSSVPGENPDSDESSIGFQEFNKNPISMFDNALLNFDNIDSEFQNGTFFNSKKTLYSIHDFDSQSIL